MNSTKARPGRTSRGWTRRLCVGVTALALSALPTAAYAQQADTGRHGSGTGSGSGGGTVVNPAFNADGTGTATPAGWTTTGTAGASFTETTGYGYNSDPYQLTHWSTAAYKVDTSQRVTGLANGDYTLGAWVKSSGGDNANYMELQSGRNVNKTAVPVISDGSWLYVVTSVHVVGHEASIHLISDSNAGDWTNYGLITLTPGYASLPIRGGDVSSLVRGEQDGGVYYAASGKQENALQILGQAGMNYARLRVWVNPVDGFGDEQQLLAGARQAKTHGMKILLDFHYSDTWTDPGHQTPPAAWANDSLGQLETDLYTYSKKVVSDLVRQGTPPDMVQTGNEVNGGFLWPTGLDYGSDSSWPTFGALLKSAISGVKAADPHTKIALHIADAADWGGVEWFYDNAEAQGVPFDVVALSYYSYWHGYLDELQSTLDDTAARYGKPIILAETAYPWTLQSGDPTASLSFSDASELETGYPATPAGQEAMFRDTLSIVQAVPGGLGLGAFYWEPTWTVVKGNGWDPTDPTSGDGWENQAMFDYGDTALPVIGDYAPR
ncbi:MAG TPA: arabinogalactan endo-1,4-beta-galactosidase [Actinospica sp.]|nr:arabinogalactan endo-1,4-beta-galactosidase [Actinospica sp.]